MKKYLSVLFILTGLSIPSFAQPGNPDLTFGGTGIVQIVDFIGTANAVAVQQDGKILIGGYWEDSVANQSCAIARFLDDGSLDSTFDNDGILKTFYPGIIHSLAIQPDHKIVAGFSNLSAISRLNFFRIQENGPADSSFGFLGVVEIILGFTDIKCYAVALQPDGKIIATGYGSTGLAADSIIVARLYTDGSPDSSFHSDGIGIYGVTSFSQGHDLLVDPDNKILITGSPSFVMRVDSTGVPDPSFNGTGVLQIQQPGFLTSYSVLVQPDAKIVIGGDQYVVRLQPNGNPDSLFGTNGFVNTQQYFTTDLTLQPDGKIVSVGGIVGFSGTDIAASRFTTGGVMDVSFGLTGITAINISGNDQATAVALQPDGKVVLASIQPSLQHYMNCIRLVNDPFLGVEEPGSTSITVFPNPANEWIRISGLKSDRTFSIRVLNVLGIEVMSEYFESKTESSIINLSELKPGIYFLTVQTSSITSTIKFVKN